MDEVSFAAGILVTILSYCMIQAILLLVDWLNK